MEGSVPTAQTLHETHSGRQEQKSNCDGSGTRTAGFHLGHRRENGTRVGAIKGRLKKRTEEKPSNENEGRADGSGRAHEKENPRAFYAVRPTDSTPAPGPRQLPTDHDPAVSTRVYRSDQSSLSVHRCHLLGLPTTNGLDLPLSRKIQPGRTTNQNPSNQEFHP